MDRAAHLARARRRGVNPLVYWIVRGVFQPFFHIWFRMGRLGREHIPGSGPVILASNHRSFLDPFVIGMLTRRPVYYMAKQELFTGRVRCWWLVRVGAFPIERGAGDRDSMGTARAILEQGGIVLIFPEGTRIRRGPLATPQRGLGRLALQTGATVVPVAIHGTQDVRRGWRVRPRRVTVRAGVPIAFPRIAGPTAAQAAQVSARVWPRVALQWEWLGGTAPIRRAVVLGTSAWGTALAIALSRAGIAVTLGAADAGRALELSLDHENAGDLPGVELPRGVTVVTEQEADTIGADVVCHATADRLAITTPSGARAAIGASAPPAQTLADGARVTVHTTDADLGAGLADALRRAGLRARVSDDPVVAALPAPTPQRAPRIPATTGGRADPQPALGE